MLTYREGDIRFSGQYWLDFQPYEDRALELVLMVSLFHRQGFCSFSRQEERCLVLIILQLHTLLLTKFTVILELICSVLLVSHVR